MDVVDFQKGSHIRYINVLAKTLMDGYWNMTDFFFHHFSSIHYLLPSPPTTMTSTDATTTTLLVHGCAPWVRVENDQPFAFSRDDALFCYVAAAYVVVDSDIPTNETVRLTNRVVCFRDENLAWEMSGMELSTMALFYGQQFWKDSTANRLFSPIPHHVFHNMRLGSAELPTHSTREFADSSHPSNQLLQRGNGSSTYRLHVDLPSDVKDDKDRAVSLKAYFVVFIGRRPIVPETTRMSALQITSIARPVSVKGHEADAPLVVDLPRELMDVSEILMFITVPSPVAWWKFVMGVDLVDEHGQRITGTSPGSIHEVLVVDPDVRGLYNDKRKKGSPMMSFTWTDWNNQHVVPDASQSGVDVRNWKLRLQIAEGLPEGSDFTCFIMHRI